MITEGFYSYQQAGSVHCFYTPGPDLKPIGLLCGPITVIAFRTAFNIFVGEKKKKHTEMMCAFN